MISLMDAQLPQYKNEEVELAVLWFLDQSVSPASAQLKGKYLF